jgi:hypothetical protein
MRLSGPHNRSGREAAGKNLHRPPVKVTNTPAGLLSGSANANARTNFHEGGTSSTLGQDPNKPINDWLQDPLW